MLTGEDVQIGSFRSTPGAQALFYDRFRIVSIYDEHVNRLELFATVDTSLSESTAQGMCALGFAQPARSGKECDRSRSERAFREPYKLFLFFPEELRRTKPYGYSLFNLEAMRAQRRWGEISGVNRTHYCGAYWFYGFHECGLNSALRVARALDAAWVGEARA